MRTAFKLHLTGDKTRRVSLQEMYRKPETPRRVPVKVKMNTWASQSFRAASAPRKPRRQLTKQREVTLAIQTCSFYRKDLLTWQPSRVRKTLNLSVPRLTVTESPLFVTHEVGQS